MCGRYALEPALPEIRNILAMISEPVKTGEIFPTDMAPVLRLEADEAMPAAMSWGFPRWDRRGATFNVRSEGALKKPTFRSALLADRVAVPTTGYYAWHGHAKYIFRDPANPVLYLAGFYKYVEGLPCFAILTAEATPGLQSYHDRMPVLLHPCETESWVRGDAMQAVLDRPQFALEATRAG